MIPASVGALARVRPREPDQRARDSERPTEPRDIDEAWAHFTRRHSVAFMFMREHFPAVRLLGRGPWALLQAIAGHWQAGRTDAYPGQERLAMISGYDVRSIRVFARELEDQGLVHLVRERLADGTARIHYEPGRGLLVAVEQFDAKYSDERAHLRKAVPFGREGRGTVRARHLVAGDGPGRRRLGEQAKGEGQASPPDQAEMASGGPAELVSGELSDPRDPKNSSSFSRLARKNARNEEQGLNGSEVDREIALEALRTLRERRFGRGVRLFDANVIDLVVACGSAIEGDEETKRRAQHDAIEHAFAVSRGKPTPSFIWGSIDHFFEHEQCGRKSPSGARGGARA